ncbi:MAG: hypothetical protein ACRC46_11595 [Thermoguttaceae bacterium]
MSYDFPGQIPEDVRKTIKVADPVDETVPLLPMVAWGDALATSTFANDNMRRSLFTGDTEIKEYKAYCDFVGRLNAILRGRETQPLVALYYPIRQLQREYIPTATPLDIKSQSQLAQRLVASFDAIGTAPYRGTLHLPNTPSTLCILNPQTGDIRNVEPASEVALELDANESVIVWGECE